MFNPLPGYIKSGSYYLPWITFCNIEPNVCYRFKSHVFHTYCVLFFLPLPTSIFSMPNICVAYKRSKFSTQQRSKPHNDMYDLTFNVLGNSGNCVFFVFYIKDIFFLSSEFKIKIKDK